MRGGMDQGGVDQGGMDQVKATAMNTPPIMDYN